MNKFDCIEFSEYIENKKWREAVKPLIAIKDPQTGQEWKLDKFKEIKNIYADVYERWVINCVIPKQIIDKILPLDFLEPVLVNGKAVLSLCAIFMRHAAPSWMPLSFGPSSKNCALRIACIDKRDGSPAVWVDPRYTDSFLGPIVGLLGFPPVQNNLTVEQSDGELNFLTKKSSLECRLKACEQSRESSLFPESTDFDDYFCAGIRSYSSNDKARRIDIIDLHKLKDNKFKKMDYEGSLQTEYGTWFVESVYLTEDGHYQWVHEGKVE